MNNYTVTGKFKNGLQWNNFKKVVSSQNEKNAVEKVYSTIGSQHGLQRRLIVIDSIGLEE